MESGSLLPFSHQQIVASTGLEIIVYVQSVNRLVENLFLQIFITFFDKPLIAAIRIIDGFINQIVLYWIYMNIMQPCKIGFLISQTRIPIIKPNLPAWSLIPFVDLNSRDGMQLLN